MYRLFDPQHDAARDTFGGKLPTKAQDEVPVYNVSWYAAVIFSEWVGARLPIEEEWEYACRAGTTTRFWSGDTDDDLAQVGWTIQNSNGHPHPVARKPSNAWGLHDVHGNIWEWCLVKRGKLVLTADGLIVDPRKVSTALSRLRYSPPASRQNAAYVVRGGSWDCGPVGARSSVRNGVEPSNSGWDLGFRLLLPVVESP